MATRDIACPSCAEPNPPRAKFCLECGMRLPAVAEAHLREAGERRVVTVVFADLSGFTSYSEGRDPEEVRALADEAAGGLGEIVQRYGGTVDKIIGDCVMAVFGAPTSHEDDPERAVRSALDMHAYVTEHRERFAGMPLRIGVNTGETMFAPVGPQGQYTVIGDAVNTAARLQTSAAKGEVLVGEETYRSAADVIDFEQVPPLTAKGKEEPVMAWRAVSVRGARAPRPSSSAPLVGRAQEFDRLWELWERVRTEGRPHLASIIGPPGIGKSRLLTEFTKRLEGTASVHRGRCLPFGEGITYWPVIELVKDAAGIMQNDDAETISAKLGAFLEDLGSDDLDQLRTMAAALANLVAVPTTPRGTYTVGEITQAELHWGIRRVFELHAGRRPTLLVLEDLHWAEPTLLELLGFLLEGQPGAPILILGSARPEIMDQAPAILTTSWNRRAIELEALSESESHALISELAGAAGFSDEAVSTLLRTAGGNPLFLEEIVRMLSEAGGGDGGAAAGVPGTLQSLIGSRLDGLPEREQRLAAHAAVIGGVFWSGAVGYLEEGRDGDVARGLESLEDRDVVRLEETSTIAGEREYAFKHLMIRDVAYGRLPKVRRARLHERCGEWITALPGGEELVEIVAYHLEQACRLAREVERGAAPPPVLSAVRALTRAAEKAESREGTREADRYYSRAIDLVAGSYPETSAELRLRRSSTLVALGALHAAAGQLDEVAENAERLGRPDLRCGALLQIANVAQKHGRASEARRRLEEAETVAAAVDDPRLRIRAAYELGSLRADYDGEVEEAVERIRGALRLAEELDDRPLRVEGHLRLGTLLFNAGALPDAEEQFDRCAELGREEGSLRDETRATSSLAFVKFYRGDIVEAERLALRAMEMLERTADRYLQLQNLRWLAKFALAHEDPGLAERRLREALPLAIESGGWLVVEIQRYLAEALALQGRAAEARDAAAGARASLPEEDLYARAAVLLAEAFAASAEGNWESARRGFTEALPLLGEQGLSIDLGEARIAFARALRHADDLDGALEELRLAGETFERMDARAPLEEIERERGRIEEARPRDVEAG